MYYKHGQKVDEFTLNRIADNYVVSYHASTRINQRNKNLNIKELIRNPFLAYYNTDGSINIAKDRYNYLVVVRRETDFLIVTYKEHSYNSNHDIFYKQQLALKGIKR